MTIASADVYTAINTAWDARDLETTFKDFWSEGTDDFPALHDGEATPKQPFPYCVMEVDPTTTTDRMSGGVDSLREVRDIPIRFNIQVTTVENDDRSEKEIAAFLAEEVMKVFGGHSTVAPESLSLSSGNHLWTQFVSDFGVKTDENMYQWIINYLVKVDLPVKT